MGLLQTWKTFSMGCGWSVADVRDGFHGLLLVCFRRARRFQWVLIGLSQTCERDSMRYRLSVVAARDEVHGLWLVCRRRARRFPWGVDGLSQMCKRGLMGVSAEVLHTAERSSVLGAPFRYCGHTRRLK